MTIGASVNDSLISELVADLKPQKGLPYKSLFIGLMFVQLIAVLAFVYWQLGSLLNVAGLVLGLVYLAAFGGLYQLAIPGPKASSWFTIAAAPCVGWGIYLSIVMPFNLPISSAGIGCAKEIAVIGILAAAPTILLLAKAYLITPWRTAFLAFLSNFSLGGLALAFLCNGNAAHNLFWHFAPIVGLSAILGGIGGYLIQRRQQSFTNRG